MQTENKFVSKTSTFDGKGFWGHYKDNSVGRAINHIYHICGLRYAENSIFHGNGIVTQGQKVPFATYHFDRGYPYFIFEDDNWNKRQDELLEDNDGKK